MAIAPRNEIEKRHFEALIEFGHNPDEWTFEDQLPYFRELSGTWNAESEEFMRRLSSWAPSRFELIDLIPLYYLSSLDIQTAQEMSWDTTPLPYTPFVIASDPAQYVTAYVDEHGSGITREGVDGAVPYVVWVNVGIANFTKVLAHHFAWTLVRKHGGLSQLFDAAASTQNKAILIELLRERRFKEDPEISKALRDAPYPARPTDRVSWLAPRFGNIHDLDKDILAVVAMFGRVQTTFIIGHEMGHLYLGHLGSHPRTQLLRSSSPLPFSDLFASEIEADMIGMLSIWDGYTNATEGGSASIDHTWVVPLFFLATMLGFAQATSEEENAEKWWYRLYFLCRSLKGSLREADFESPRVQRIAYAAPAITWATKEWVRLELSNAPDSEEPDYTLLYELTELFSQA